MIEASFAGPVGGFRLDAAFAVPSRGVTALYGPSGSGKTTVLRCIAGLHRIDGGRCVVDGEAWQEGKVFRPAHGRPVGYVFQEASLFAHLSVRGNLAYGMPKGRGLAFGLDEAVDLLGLAALLDRAPRHLSGGERQRVAIGRALLSQPRLLLMDEPLSALDRATKAEILPFLERLHRRVALPVIYVSHDMAEIERLADHLVLLDAGRVVAAGPLATLQGDPALPLARTRDAAVSLDAVAEGYDAAFGLAAFRVAGGVLLAPSGPVEPGARRRLGISAADVSLAREPPPPSTIVNVLPARVLELAEAGPFETVVALGLGDGDGARILARITNRSRDLLGVAPGLRVHVQIKGVALASSG